MDKKQVIRLIRLYSEKIRNHLPVREVILFGSWARDAADIDSDFDVAVFLDDVPGDYLQVEKYLHRKRREVDLRIEPVLFTSDPDHSGFSDVVKKTGIHVFP